MNSSPAVTPAAAAPAAVPPRAPPADPPSSAGSAGTSRADRPTAFRSAAHRAINDIDRHASQYLKRLESSLTTNYDPDAATADYNTVLSAIAMTENVFARFNALHVAPSDAEAADNDALIATVIAAKAEADKKYTALSTAAAAAAERFAAAPPTTNDDVGIAGK